MSIDAFSVHQEMASRSKYRRLYTHLCDKEDEQWLTSFRAIEAILGFRTSRFRSSLPTLVGESEKRRSQPVLGLDGGRVGNGQRGYGG